MPYLLVCISALSLMGCGSNYTRDGVTVVSYCLLGGVYIDDTKTTHEMKHPPTQCQVPK